MSVGAPAKDPTRVRGDIGVRPRNAPHQDHPGSQCPAGTVILELSREVGGCITVGSGDIAQARFAQVLSSGEPGRECPSADARAGWEKWDRRYGRRVVLLRSPCGQRWRGEASGRQSLAANGQSLLPDASPLGCTDNETVSLRRRTSGSRQRLQWHQGVTVSDSTR